MMLSKGNAHRKDEGYESGSKSLSIPTPSGEHQGFTTFLQVRTSLSALSQHLPQLHNAQTTPLDATALYAAI